MQHAFFADMGGFVLYPRDSKEFPVNNKHIQWLVMNRFMDFPEVSNRDIWDRKQSRPPYQKPCLHSDFLAYDRHSRSCYSQSRHHNH